MNKRRMAQPLTDETNQNQDENIVKTTHHSLYVEDIPMSFEPVVVEGEVVNNIYEKNGGTKFLKLFFGDFEEDTSMTHDMIHRLQKESGPNNILEIHISSHGGSVDELIEYFDLIKSMYSNVSSYLTKGYSAGAIAFLCGNQRIVYEASTWMIHSYSAGVYGKRDDMLKQIEHSDRRVQKFNDKVLKPFFSKKELKLMAQGQDFWLDANELLQRGIATHIIIDGEVLSSKEYFKKLKKPKKNKTKTKREKENE